MKREKIIESLVKIRDFIDDAVERDKGDVEDVIEDMLGVGSLVRLLISKIKSGKDGTND